MQSAPPPPAAPPARTDAQRTVRYNYLIERLRHRQITMEEATELFGLMQGMLRQSEAARLAALARSSDDRPAAKPAPAPKGKEPVGGPMSDDLLAAGILALGAGAGILAAISKKMAEGASGSAAAPTGRPGSR